MDQRLSSYSSRCIFTIQDLYSTLSLTPAGSLLKSNTMQNIAEMDYLANTCGVNINEPDVLRMVNMFVTLILKMYLWMFLQI